MKLNALFFSCLALIFICSLSSCIITDSTVPPHPQIAPRVPAGLAAQLKRDVSYLSVDCAPRSASHPKNQAKTVRYIADAFSKTGAEVKLIPFTAAKKTFVNVSAIFPGKTDKRIIVGAHYDTCGDTPGADDNAGAVAGLLALANMLKGSRHDCAIELIAYANEEPPFFRTGDMGSARHAKAIIADKIDVKAMLCLEMIGYFSDEEGSQSYPIPGMELFFPDKGNFIAIIGNWDSITPARHIQRSMKPYIPTVRLNMPAIGDSGLDFSDHRNFWAAGLPAVMITDTSFYRNPNYHEPTDTPNTLDYARMAKTVAGIYQAVISLAKDRPTTTKH